MTTIIKEGLKPCSLMLITYLAQAKCLTIRCLSSRIRSNSLSNHLQTDHWDSFNSHQRADHRECFNNHHRVDHQELLYSNPFNSCSKPLNSHSNPRSNPLNSRSNLQAPIAPHLKSTLLSNSSLVK